MFKTGQLSRAFEIDRTSLNYYVRTGLLNPEILDNQYHTYSFQDFVALSYIRHYRGLGFSMAQIKALTRLEDNQEKLNLTEKQKERWHKKCLCLVEFEDVEEITPLPFDHQGNMDDWLIIDKIEDVVVGTSIAYNYEKSKF